MINPIWLTIWKDKTERIDVSPKAAIEPTTIETAKAMVKKNKNFESPPNITE
mgnify:CR=1 FL=1